MLSLVNRRASAIMALALIAFVVVAAPVAIAAQEPVEAAEGAVRGLTVGDGLRAMGLAIGAGIAIAASGLGTARAQAAVGAGGTGAMAEKPELFTSVLILFAIPETIVVLGFVIAFFLYGAI